MALLVVVFVCSCGAMLSICMPKAKVLGEWLEQPGHWAADDAQQELEGPLEGFERMVGFVDGREELVCPVCGADVEHHLNPVMLAENWAPLWRRMLAWQPD